MKCQRKCCGEQECLESQGWAKAPFTAQLKRPVSSGPYRGEQEKAWGYVE